MIIEQVLAAGPTGAAPTIGSWIGGRPDEVSDAPTIDVHDPATGRLIARVVEAGEAGVERAVAAAQVAAIAWRAVPARERASLVAAFAERIAAHADDLAQLDSLDSGNPVTAMRADVAKGVRSMTDAAGLALQVKGEVVPLPGCTTRSASRGAWSDG